MIDYFNSTTTCLGPCNPKQVVNLNMAFDDVANIKILNECGDPYDTSTLEYAYSLDNVCWSCYMNYDDVISNIIGLGQDFYVRIKVNGVVSGITVDGEAFSDYSVSIAEGFTFTYCDTSTSSNQFNPYINMDCAIALQQQLTETVACMFGVPIYYFKLAPNTGSKDITFKEYALMDVDQVKQIKMVIADNQMPSSKPTFAEFGFDWETDWEVEISKGMFATAFGNTVQPTEGDLVYVPMMKRMWMVNGAYEEKRDSLMWNATTFKVTLVKYQEKGSVDLKDTQSLVDSFVKNKYDDLFGDDENVVSGEEGLSTPKHIPDNLYPVFEKDACRKYMGTDFIYFKEGRMYQRGTMLADDVYEMNTNPTSIIYQRQFCAEDGVISFIFTPASAAYKGTLIEIGNVQLNIEQTKTDCILTLVNIPKVTLTLKAGKTYFVYVRWSRMLNTVEMFAAPYTHANLPPYRLQNHHYWFDIDNGVSSVARYDIEMTVATKSDVILHNLVGTITNIKIFDQYNDNVSEILQMLPNNSHLIINDTARKLVDLSGLKG